MQEPLSAEQEAQVEQLTADILQAIAADVRKVARLLLSRTGPDTFGQTEFRLRDLSHQIGAKALEASLAQKKLGRQT
jgi:hypothetical protein